MAGLVNNGNDVFYPSGTSLRDYEEYSSRRAREEENRYRNEMAQRQMEFIQRQMYEQAGYSNIMSQERAYERINGVAGNYVSTPEPQRNKKLLLLTT